MRGFLETTQYLLELHGVAPSTLGKEERQHQGTLGCIGAHLGLLLLLALLLALRCDLCDAESHTDAVYFARAVLAAL